MRHWMMVGAPAVEKVQVGVVSLLGEASAAMVTVGAAVSTVTDEKAELLLPASSATRTSRVKVRSGARAAGVCEVAVVQAPKAAAPMRHWMMVGAPAVEKVQVGVVSLLGEASAAMVTLGAAVSTVTDEKAELLLPASSATRTSRVKV